MTPCVRQSIEDGGAPAAGPAAVCPTVSAGAAGLPLMRRGEAQRRAQEHLSGRRRLPDLVGVGRLESEPAQLALRRDPRAG